MYKKENKVPRQKTDWENVSQWYMKYLEEDADSYHAKVIIPNLLRLLGGIEGKKITDLGCGDGTIGHILARKGARIVGVDGSQTLIAKAKKEAQKNETYLVQDVRKGLPKGCKESDACVSILAIQNMDMIRAVFDSVSKHLVPKGSFHIVTLHPSFRIPKESDWYFDPKTKKQGRVTFTYMSEKKVYISQNPSKQNSAQSVTFHRPLQVYSKNLQNSGFVIKRIEEWCSHKESEQGRRKTAEDAARQEIPMFLYIEAIRVQ